ncbi:hypothetical protein [Lysobacter gummosus]
MGKPRARTIATKAIVTINSIKVKPRMPRSRMTVTQFDPGRCLIAMRCF